MMKWERKKECVDKKQEKHTQSYKRKSGYVYTEKKTTNVEKIGR